MGIAVANPSAMPICIILVPLVSRDLKVEVSEGLMTHHQYVQVSMLSW